MPFEMVLLFLIVAVVLGAVLVAVWRYWENAVNVSPEDDEFDKRVAALNERQSNRLSDDVLRADIDEESAWQIMVERGRRAARRRTRSGGTRERRAAGERRPRR